MASESSYSEVGARRQGASGACENAGARRPGASGAHDKAGASIPGASVAHDNEGTRMPGMSGACENAGVRDGGAAAGKGDAVKRGGETKRERLWSPLFVFIIIMTLCCFVVGQGLNSGTSVFLDHMGEGATVAGILATVFSGAAAVARLACGPIIDNVGRVVVMVGGAAFLFVGTIVPAFVSDTMVIAVCRVLQGIGFSAATTASATAASDVLPLSRLGEGIGYYGLGQALAMSIGPALALFLVNTDPAANLFWGMSVMAALAFVFAMLCRYEKNPARLPETSSYRPRAEANAAAARAARKGAFGTASQREAAAVDRAGAVATAEAVGVAGEAGAVGGTGAAGTAEAAEAAGTAETPQKPRKIKQFIDGIFEPHALPGMIPMLILSPAFGFSIFFMGLYGTSLGYANAGLFYTVSAVAMIGVRLVSKAFMDTVAPFKIMVVTVACGLVGFTMALFGGQNELLFYLAGLPYGVCVGVAIPLNQSVAVKNSPADRWGAANALYLLASDIGIGVASAVWGIVNDAAGFPVTIMCAMCCMAVSLVVAWFAYPGHGMKPMTSHQAESR
ncbi:MAG TPA: MFS transporter [Candidatus Aphodovivens excrementavium]|nr:MFS transporter [Candidatus Aphodovivens excrementavium]